MSSELRVLTIDYATGQSEHILFSIADLKQAAAILDELPALVEDAESAGSWDIITITDSRLLEEQLLLNVGWDRKNDQILIEQQLGQIDTLTKQVSALKKINEELRATLSDHADVATNLREIILQDSANSSHSTTNEQKKLDELTKQLEAARVLHFRRGEKIEKLKSELKEAMAFESDLKKLYEDSRNSSQHQTLDQKVTEVRTERSRESLPNITDIHIPFTLRNDYDCGGDS